MEFEGRNKINKWGSLFAFLNEKNFSKHANIFLGQVRRDANALSAAEKAAIWVPALVFTSTENNDLTAADGESDVTVSRQTDFARSGPETVEEINIFPGSTNKAMLHCFY